jgi:hypothetical protein
MTLETRADPQGDPFLCSFAQSDPLDVVVRLEAELPGFVDEVPEVSVEAFLHAVRGRG